MSTLEAITGGLMATNIMIRQWEISTESGPFLFVAEDKELAHAHATMLRDDPDFVNDYGAVLVSDNLNEKVRSIAVRFTRWVSK